MMLGKILHNIKNKGQNLKYRNLYLNLNKYRMFNLFHMLIHKQHKLYNLNLNLKFQKHLNLK